MNLLGISELSKEQIFKIVELGEKFKAKKIDARLPNKTLAMLFEKPSTRTRVSFEVAMTQLGGHAIYVDYVGSQISRGESIADTARTLSRYVDIVMARLYKHSDLIELAQNSSIPIINGLTDLEHPCQTLGDILTIKEKKGFGGKRKLAFVGDCACNVANSLLLACSKVGIDVSLICPPGYPPNQKFLDEARKSKQKIEVSNKIEDVEGADIIYTDVWVSMGFEEERAERMKAFAPYVVNEKVLEYAKKDCIVMHCLPAHRGLEITSEVLDGPNSVVWDQAENRLHIHKAILLYLLKDGI